MNLLGCWAALAASLAVLGLANAVELTFELPDNAKECFFEEIEKGTEATLESTHNTSTSCCSPR